jgi:hypothetical protein
VTKKTCRETYPHWTKRMSDQEWLCTEIGDRGGGGEAGSAGLCGQHRRCSTVYNFCVTKTKRTFEILVLFDFQGFDGQKFKILQLLQIKFFDQKLLFTYPRTPKLQGESSFIKREPPALQKWNFLLFCGSFCPSASGSRSIIQTTKMNADPCGSDPQHC